MVRNHGWELPAHAFQVVAITVFLLLVVAYYVFFAPFVGPRPFQYGAYALYSPLVFIVFFLYVRCTGINPADSGTTSVIDQQKYGEMQEIKGFMSESSGSMAHRQGSSEIPVVQVEDSVEPPGVLSIIAGAFCGWLVIPDTCKRESTEPSLEDDNLYCTLCEAEVHKFSKHCRSCDKCVDGFDHHCRWLNNCVGKKNYASFVVLMASSLALLILHWGTGIAVLVRCFTTKAAKHQIVEKLGNGFSRAPFAAVVAVCTLVSLAASVPLAELFFFHVILMRKGITTYEYVVAMRAQNEPTPPSVDGDAQSVPSSPGSSVATGLTGSSSVGLQYRGAWCTPPRVFVDHQDEVIPHLEPGRVPSTVDPDSLPKSDKKAKRPVRISAWKLAKLDAGEVTKAAARAREKSSVMRQVSGRDEGDYSSSDIGSSRSSASTEFGALRGKRIEEKFTASKMAMPIQRGEFNMQMQFDSGDGGITSSRSSLSSPSRHTLNDSDGLSPLPSRPNYAPVNTLRLSTPRQENAPPLGVRTSGYKPPHLYPPGGVQTSRPWGFGKSEGSSLDSLDDLVVGRQRVQVYDDLGGGRQKVQQVYDRPGMDNNRNSVYSYLRQWPTSTYDVENPPPRSNPPAPAVRRPALPKRPDDLLYQEKTIFFGGALGIPGTNRSSLQHQNQPQQQQQQQQPVSRLNPVIPTRSNIPGGPSSIFPATYASDPRQQRFIPTSMRASMAGTDRLNSPVFLPRSSGAYPPR